MDISHIILILLIIFLGALIRSYFGFGEALVSMPLLSILGLDLNSSISIIGLAGLVVALIYTTKEFENINYNALIIMLVSSLIGVPIGIYILNHFNINVIQKLLAVALILYGFTTFFKRLFFKFQNKIELESKFWTALAGLISGILGSLYNTHGVPIVIYGAMSKYDLKDFKNTIQAHFLLTSIFVVLGQATGNIWTNDTLPIFFMSMPFLIIATYLGKYLVNKTSNHNFEIWVFLMIAILGSLMLYTTI
ncbi:sulfite exporter TauE/SafE family protein [Mammaliicoccus vitulinus]|uniref:sulfite exporter TauE/SafE family protein n=1 Tax=Mammaliicoccus vitulinus TaxID=71237 RepID=UPI001951DCF0|nr:sulfite exporter TauE/SafE family protein [Mammaliicoccus vitulinus]MBM6628758.1 sulfite exporter TauE/SafE family protein [Mammaliicoccus vitulinus]MBO3076765.1 sulfite exporter TauE/SafE family protein [Mammaliicoccus vitulinus]